MLHKYFLMASILQFNHSYINLKVCALRNSEFFILKCILRVKETEVLTDPYWICYVSPKWKKIFTSFYILAKPEVSLLPGRRLAQNQAALSLPMCLEAKLNPRCSPSILLDKLILGIITEN